MVSMAQNRSLPEVLRAIVDGMAACSNVVLARIWLVGPGDLCASCRFRSECPDTTRCLHLVASAGNPINPGVDYSRVDGAFRRFPMGVRKIGRVGLMGEPMWFSGLDGDEDWIAEPEWFRTERVQTFAAQPLLFRQEVLGVLGLFDRMPLSSQDIEWLQIVADHASVSIANARAFEEIEHLKERLQEENRYLRREVTEAVGDQNLVGQSPGLKKVLQQIELVAPTEAAVLIHGESGTGKELVARAIHERSARKDRALIKVNCGAVPESLFESEFFGHVRGAFTGAIRDKPGRFELAEGGTLFLDEIGDVPLSLQPKLLRVLQEKELERVGDPRTRRVNVRILAATHRDLKKEVAAGRFREDLYYRLSVFPIEIPPLRERRDDIEPLVTHFVAQAARRMNRSAPRLTPLSLTQLRAHTWPGNIRELQNAVERAVILSQRGPLQFDIGSPITGAMPPPAASGSSGTPPLLTRDQLKRQERDSIAEALRQTGGKIFGTDGAASLLGMRPTTLASRIQALGLGRRRTVLAKRGSAMEEQTREFLD